MEGTKDILWISQIKIQLLRGYIPVFILHKICFYRSVLEVSVKLQLIYFILSSLFVTHPIHHPMITFVFGRNPQAKKLRLQNQLSKRSSN